MDTITQPPYLYQTVLKAAEFIFNGGNYSLTERNDLVEVIISSINRQKGFVFFPTALEREMGIRLISGEKPRTQLLANNAVELETLRLLALLQPEHPTVQELFLEAGQRLEKQCFANVCLVGECAGASIAYLRYLSARGLGNNRAKITHGLNCLKQDRSGNGRWHHFPYRFTLRWLSELPSEVVGYERTYVEKAR